MRQREFYFNNQVVLKRSACGYNTTKAQKAFVLGRFEAPDLLVCAGNFCNYHFGPATLADCADLFDGRCFDLNFFLDAQKLALVDLDRHGDGLVAGADQ
jgi:hypothetical protein